MVQLQSCLVPHSIAHAAWVQHTCVHTVRIFLGRRSLMSASRLWCCCLSCGIHSCDLSSTRFMKPMRCIIAFGQRGWHGRAVQGGCLEEHTPGPSWVRAPGGAAPSLPGDGGPALGLPGRCPEWLPHQQLSVCSVCGTTVSNRLSEFSKICAAILTSTLFVT